MLAKIFDFVKARKADILLFTIIVLLILLSFASGFIIAKYQQKQPIQIYGENS
jgi:multisubunit Na+/H+ antiporter MnhF subunit